jgi:hypothetical protein
MGLATCTGKCPARERVYKMLNARDSGACVYGSLAAKRGVAWEAEGAGGVPVKWVRRLSPDAH